MIGVPLLDQLDHPWGVEGLVHLHEQREQGFTQAGAGAAPPDQIQIGADPDVAQYRSDDGIVVCHCAENGWLRKTKSLAV